MVARTVTPLLLCFAAAANAQTFLVNDTFDDLERATQNTPSSLQWTVGAHNGTAANAFGTLNASPGKLVLDHTGPNGSSFATALGYFTESGSPFTLAVGETLRLSFDVSFSGGNFTASSNAFRWALLDSGGSRVTTDFAGANETGVASGSTFSAWRGYEGLLPVNNVVGATGDFQIRERNNTGNGLFISAQWAGLAGSTVAEPLFQADTTYSGFLEVTRSAAGVSLQAGINGVETATVLDSNIPRVSFDTIAFFTLDVLTHDIVVDNVQVTVVPEPSSALAALVGATVLGCVRRRRRE